MSDSNYKINKGVVYPPPPTLASNEEFTAGTSDTASPSVKQVKDEFVSVNKDQNINSRKYFTFHPFITTGTQENRIVHIFSDLAISDIPTANHWGGCVTTDKDGQEIGTVFTYISTNGDVGSALLARNPTNPSEAKTLNIFYTADGVPHTYCITPPSNSNDGNIATTAWVRQNATPTGSYLIWSTSTPPYGYLICDGSPISRTTYAKLFAVIGTTYGNGDGSTTFNLPDLRDRTIWYSTAQTVGHKENGSLPAIKGDLGYEAGTDTRPLPVNGAIKRYFGTVSSNTRIFANYASTSKSYFDASGSSSIYRSDDVQIVVPTALDVVFCIKYL